jgi:hypothetical protein
MTPKDFLLLAGSLCIFTYSLGVGNILYTFGAALIVMGNIL